ncbi:ubiquitin carboxyl-terminal hydrolase, partial [Gregarina niphandrodes]
NLWRPEMSLRRWDAGDFVNFNGLNPRSFKAALDRELSQFQGYSQHDSQELMSGLIDILVGAGAAYSQTEDIDSKTVKQNGESKLWRDHWKIYQQAFSAPYRPLHKLFHGFGSASIECLTCGEFNIKMEPITLLSLPILNDQNQPLTSLSKALEYYFKPEIL